MNKIHTVRPAIHYALMANTNSAQLLTAGNTMLHGYVGDVESDDKSYFEYLTSAST